MREQPGASDSDESEGVLVIDMSTSTDDDGYCEAAAETAGLGRARPLPAFNCEICSYGTDKVENLQRHILRNHTGRKYRCAQCGSQFNRRDYVKNHQRRSPRCQGCEIEDISERLAHAGTELHHRPPRSGATAVVPPVPLLAPSPPRVQRYDRYFASLAAEVGRAAISAGRFAYRFEPGLTAYSRSSPRVARCRSELLVQISPLRLPEPGPPMVEAATQTGVASLRALVTDALRHITLGIAMPGASAIGPQVVTLDVVQQVGTEPDCQEGPRDPSPDQ